jgi:hypothetical protein
MEIISIITTTNKHHRDQEDRSRDPSCQHALEEVLSSSAPHQLLITCKCNW